MSPYLSLTHVGIEQRRGGSEEPPHSCSGMSGKEAHPHCSGTLGVTWRVSGLSVRDTANLFLLQLPSVFPCMPSEETSIPFLRHFPEASSFFSVDSETLALCIFFPYLMNSSDLQGGRGQIKGRTWLSLQITGFFIDIKSI